MFETIAFDFEKQEFYIKRAKTTDFSGKVEKLPLSTWGFTKEATVQAVIFREIPSLDLEKKTRKLFYAMELTYSIDSKFKELMLKVEPQKCSLDRFEITFSRVHVKDLNTGSSQEAPIPNANYEPQTMPFLSIKKGKAKLLKHSELNELLKSSVCCGIFNEDMSLKKTSF